MISLRKNNILERLSGKTQYIMKSIKNFLRCGTLKDFVFVSFFVKYNQGGQGGAFTNNNRKSFPADAHCCSMARASLRQLRPRWNFRAFEILEWGP